MRRRRRAAGLCTQCGRPTDGHRLCKMHHAHLLAQQRTKRRLWVKQGLCNICGKPSGGHYRCSRHNAMKNAAQVKKRERWLADGRCRHCGRPLGPLGGEYGLTSCPVCQAAWDEQRRNVRNRRR